MKTELVVSEPEIIPGQKIEAEQYNVKNFRLHKMLENISRLQIYLVECDSNMLSEYLGSGVLKEGSSPDNPKYEVGVEAPNYTIMGAIVPDVDHDSATMAERSRHVSPPLAKDAPDVDR